MNPKRIMIGTVTNVGPHNVTVETVGEPAHLQTLDIPRRGKTFSVGDRVKLGYYITSTSGLWEVMEKL